jgi:hypothetical protein
MLLEGKYTLIQTLNHGKAWYFPYSQSCIFVRGEKSDRHVETSALDPFGFEPHTFSILPLDNQFHFVGTTGLQRASMMK